MKTSIRFEQALQKLYKAFHENTLNPECCQQCAVGNILDQTDAWKHLSDHHGSLHLNYVGKIHESIGRKFNGYKPSELLQIEASFLKGCGYSIPLRFGGSKPEAPTSKETLFDGLCTAIACMCKLDDIPDFMNYKQWFQKDHISEKTKKTLVHLQ